MIVLDADCDLGSTSPGVDHWLDDCSSETEQGRGRLPSAIVAVAARALGRRPDESPEVAVSRVLTRSGRWLILHGITLEAGPERRVAAIIELADPARIAPLLMSAYGLTDREQELTRCVLQGLSTSEIAAELVISVHNGSAAPEERLRQDRRTSRRELVTKTSVTTSHGCGTTSAAPSSACRPAADPSPAERGAKARTDRFGRHEPAGIRDAEHLGGRRRRRRSPGTARSSACSRTSRARDRAAPRVREIPDRRSAGRTRHRGQGATPPGRWCNPPGPSCTGTSTTCRTRWPGWSRWARREYQPITPHGARHRRVRRRPVRERARHHPQPALCRDVGRTAADVTRGFGPQAVGTAL